MPKCCYRCFKDPWLKGLIHAHADKLGTCRYCGSQQVALVDLAVLRDPIRNLLSLYTPLSAGDVVLPWEDPFDVGEYLPDLIQDDWQIFSDALVDSETAIDLMYEIDLSGWEKDSGEDLVDKGDLYTRRSNVYHTSPTEAWESFCEDVRHNPGAEPEFRVSVEDELFKAEARIAQGTILFRARPGCNCGEDGTNEPYVDKHIGAPPNQKARAARLNKQGEVLLYCADQKLTAIGEVRPWRGLVVTVGQFKARRDLRILDLSWYLATPNPFTTEQLPYELEITNLVNGFGDDLSRPLERPDDAYGYLPSQKLSQIILAAGFDGVRYRSAMEPNGTNVAFYDPTVLEFTESKLVRVTSVRIDSEDC